MSKKTVFNCDYCESEISEYHKYRLLGMVSENSSALSMVYQITTLSFYVWSDEAARVEGVLHFCTDAHAGRYFECWIDDVRKPTVFQPEIVDAEYAEVEPLPTPIPMVAEQTTESNPGAAVNEPLPDEDYPF